VHCLGKAKPNDRERLISILSAKDPEQKDIDDAINLLEEHGSIEYARKMAISLAEDAKSYLESLPDSKDKESLLKISDYVVTRES
jgi:geranylgeranyl pyrophosphate synthase